MSDVILSIKDLKINYGGIEAVKGISTTVGRGSESPLSLQQWHRSVLQLM